MSSSDPPPPIARPRPPTFTLLALGTGGGPLETNLSAYLLKPASSAWSGGCVSLEAGSGIGALVELLAKDKVLWRKFGFDELSQAGLPTVGQGEVWQAGKVMQTMRAYLITHAHLDHVSSLILGSGGLPPPRPPATAFASSVSANNQLNLGESFNSTPAGSPKSDSPPWSNTRAVYGSLETLINLQSAFEERIWPDIGGFERAEKGVKVVRFLEITPPTPQPSASTSTPVSTKTVDRQTPIKRSQRSNTSSSPPLILSTTQTPASLPPSTSAALLPAHVLDQTYTPLPTTPPLSVLAFPISHGTCSSVRRGSNARCCDALHETCASRADKGKEKEQGWDALSRAMKKEDDRTKAPLVSYEASAFFVRYDQLDSELPTGVKRSEFCFFGDVEPDSISLNPRNRRVWEEIACRFQASILDTIFLECSYDDSRPDHLLYGHLCPRHILAELSTLHSILASTSPSPPTLKGLKVNIIHVKETLESVGDGQGGIQARIWRQLEEGKEILEGGVLRDVHFHLVKRGEILEF